MKNDSPLDALIRMLGTLPGLGPRSARRLALYLLTRRESVMQPLAQMIGRTAEEIRECSACGMLDLHNPCAICRDSSRDPQTLCVVAQVSDAWAVERTKSFKGRYHVLGGVLSALDGTGPEDLRIASLLARVEAENISEIILALGATVDGQSTAHYLADRLAGTSATVSRLAHGVPFGGELDYLDDGTISTALRARSRVA